MKNLFIYIICLFSFSSYGQDFTEILKNISDNNLQEISNSLDEMVDYCFGDEPQYLSQSELLSILSRDIKKIEPNSSKLVHDKQSNGKNSIYGVGEIINKQGAVYRVFIYIENDRITEIQIKKPKS